MVGEGVVSVAGVRVGRAFGLARSHHSHVWVWDSGFEGEDIMKDWMTVKDAEALGRVHGEDLVLGAMAEGVPLDEVEDAVFGAVEHFRSYSPFEVYASAINRRPGEWGPERGWEAYETGFERGVRAAIREGRE